MNGINAEDCDLDFLDGDGYEEITGAMEKAVSV
jgi:hypothetical protein